MEMEIKVGDFVKTASGRRGFVVDICRCKRCADRGYFEPKIQFEDGETDYITDREAELGYKGYFCIGKNLFPSHIDLDYIYDEAKERARVLLKGIGYE